MKELENLIESAFLAADQLQQGGNASMVNVKLKLKETAAHFSPKLSAKLAGQLGVGQAGSFEKKSFKWVGPLPGANKGTRKKSVAPAGAQPADTKKGTVVEETEPGLYESLAALTPAKISKQYKDSINEIAEGLGVVFEEKWNAIQKAAAVRKAAKDKVA